MSEAGGPSLIQSDATVTEGADASMGAKRRVALGVAVIALVGSGCAKDDTSSAPKPSASETPASQALSEEEYLQRVDVLCGKQGYVVEDINSSDTPAEFVKNLESHFDETVTFIEALDEIDPPTAFKKDHQAFVTHEEEIQEVDELLNQLPRSDLGSVLAAHARRAELVQELHYVVEFSELPESCRFESEALVLTIGFFTKANLSCFEFANDLVTLFQQEAAAGPEDRFGAEFIGVVKERAEQLITDLDTAVPDIGGFKKIFNMITLYAEAVEALDEVEKALARGDVPLGTAAMKDYDRATLEGDRLAHDLEITCEGAMHIDWRPVNEERVN